MIGCQKTEVLPLKRHVRFEAALLSFQSVDVYTTERLAAGGARALADHSMLHAGPVYTTHGGLSPRLRNRSRLLLIFTSLAIEGSPN